MVNRVEEDILYKTSGIWNNFISLEQTHPDDIEDMKKCIYNIQRIIAARIVRRDHPETFKTVR